MPAEEEGEGEAQSADGADKAGAEEGAKEAEEGAKEAEEGAEDAEEGAKKGKEGATEAEEDTKAADERKKPSAGGAKKVTIRKSVAERISLFNVSGELKKPIRLSVVALALSKLDEKAALDVLDALLEASDDVEDPNTFVCKKAREVAKEKAEEEAARLAAEEPEEEEWQEEGEGAAETGEEVPKKKKKKKKAKAEEVEEEEEEEDNSPEAAVKRRIKALNESETLWEPIRFKRLEVLMPMIGAKELDSILDKLETRAEDLGNPTAWVRKEVMRRLGPVLSRCDQLNRSVPGKMDLLEAIDLPKVKEPLSALPESTAFRILKELEDKALEVPDPSSWIIEEAKKKAPSGPIVEHLQRLNASGRLQQMLDLGRALDILSAVDQKKATLLLSNLGTRAEKIRNPIGWLASEVRIRWVQPAAKAAAAAAALKAAKAGQNAAKAPGPVPPKRPPPGAAAGKGGAAKRPRTAEVAEVKASAKTPAAAAEAAAEDEELMDVWEREAAAKAAAEPAEEAEEAEEAVQFDDADGEDPDAIG